MTTNNVEKYSVVVSDEVLATIRGHNAKSSNEMNANGTTKASNFTIRYSTPPELLKGSNCDLSLRKTTRGEYIVEDASASTPVQGMEKEKGSTSSSGRLTSGPSFRGPGTPAQEGECVLVYNEEKQKYELHILNINFQVSPVLKGRSRTSTSSALHAPLRDRPPQQALVSSPPRNTASKPSSPKPATKLGSHGNGASAVLQPKTTSRARLPTRRKLSPTKPKPKREAVLDLPVNEITPEYQRSQIIPSLSPRNDSPNPLAQVSSRAITPRSVLPDNNNTDTSSISAMSSVSLESATSSLSPPDKTSYSPQPAEADVPSLEETFDDLADELADELTGDDEDQAYSMPSLGTAGGSANDDDVSSEEE